MDRISIPTLSLSPMRQVHQQLTHKKTEDIKYRIACGLPLERPAAPTQSNPPIPLPRHRTPSPPRDALAAASSMVSEPSLYDIALGNKQTQAAALALQALFSAALERPAALWNHFQAQDLGDELQPPYGCCAATVIASSLLQGSE
jgi:hypothetical protein